MTIGGFVCGFLLSLIPIIAIFACIYFITQGDHVVASIVGLIVSVLALVAIWGGLIVYYNFTAAGQRSMKTQKSELGTGMQREVTVYDMQGDVIDHYEGKFDIDFNSDQSGQRIVFDDEEGLRHVIYPGGGIVIINEVKE